MTNTHKNQDNNLNEIKTQEQLIQESQEATSQEGIPQVENKVEDIIDDFSFLEADVLNFLEKTFTKIGLSNKLKNAFYKEVIFFQEESKQQKIAKAFRESEKLTYKIKNIWGTDTKENKLLVQRATQWLECQDNDDGFCFLNKMVDLGKILSEGKTANQNQGFSQEFGLSKEEALKKRHDLINNKDFLNAMNSKTHSDHKLFLNKLNHLNEIISQT